MYLYDYILNCDLFTTKQQFIISTLLKGKRKHDFFCSITNMFKSSQSVSMTITLLNKKVNCISTRDNQSFDLYSINVGTLLNYIKNKAGVSCVYQLFGIEECDLVLCKETYMHDSDYFVDIVELSDKTENELNSYLLDLSKNDVNSLLKELQMESIIELVNHIDSVSKKESIKDFFMNECTKFVNKILSSDYEQDNLRQQINMNYLESTINDNLTVTVDKSMFSCVELSLIEFIDSSFYTYKKVNFDCNQAIKDLLKYGLDEYYNDDEIIQCINSIINSDQLLHIDFLLKFESSILSNDIHKIMSVFDFINSCLSYDKKENQLNELIYIKHELQNHDLALNWSCKFCDDQHNNAGELVLCDCHFKQDK